LGILASLTRPTRGRIALWAVLTLLWFALLPQDLVHDPDHSQLSWSGAFLWAVVLVWLVVCLVLTWRKYRAASRGLGSS
jgi:hypothetical protein